MEPNCKPHVGMEFDNVDDAWSSWRDYGEKIGFGVTKDQNNKSKEDKTITTSVRYVCSKEGICEDKKGANVKKPRAETRSGCMARLVLRLEGGKYKVHQFIEEHNHILHTVETSHMLCSQRKISKTQAYEIELVEDSGLRQKACLDLMSMHTGGRASLGDTRVDAKNYLQSRRKQNMEYGDAGVLLQYFQRQLSENPSFYHAYQMDCEEQISNVFCADARMLIDYGLFGDRVTLDTTFSTKKKGRPLAILCGFNHYRGMVIFGAALLCDETAESFKWIFQTFLEAHQGKYPLKVFTDQDAAMVKALKEVMPETVHGLCTWNLMKNSTKQLAQLPQGESHVLSELSWCMYEAIDEDEFEGSWSKTLIDHDVQDDLWLLATYEIREKWGACFMKKSLTLGMRSTQLSESLNSELKDLLNPKLDLILFFKHFERIVEEKRYNEIKAEYEAREKNPRVRNLESSMLLHLSEIYTSPIFDLFHQEYDKVAKTYVKTRDESASLRQYVISLVNTR